MVSLAGNRLRLNAAFAEVANLDRYNFVGVYNTNTGEVALKFFVTHAGALPDIDDEDYIPGAHPLPANVLPMQRDGGRKDIKGRVVSCGHIINYSDILRAAKEASNAACRQFLPVYDEGSESWLLRPMAASSLDVPF